MSERRRIAAQSGTAVELRRDDVLVVVDPEGEQVADLFIIAQGDAKERYSGGRTIDYNQTIRLGIGSVLYSNRSTPLLEIVADTVGIHDALLAPCSGPMFVFLRQMYGHPSCLANIAAALGPYGVDGDDVATTFNAFMNVPVETDGRITIERPASRAGDQIALRALRPVVVAITACSSEHSNGGRCKPIDIEVRAAR